jgi:hypothetical protein
LRRITGEWSPQNRSERRERTTTERERRRKRAIKKRYVPHFFKPSGMLDRGNPDAIGGQINLIATRDTDIPVMWIVNHSAGNEG